MCSKNIVAVLHCPQFGPDRTKPTGPGFGPLRGQTRPKCTGPRSRAKWTGPEGWSWVGPCLDLKRRRRKCSVTLVHLRFNTSPSSLVWICFHKWDPLAHSHFNVRPSIAEGCIQGSRWYTGVPYLFFYSSYFLTASHRVSSKEEKPSLLWYTSTQRGNLPLLVELVLSQCNKGGEISYSHASSFQCDGRCNTPHCHFHVAFGGRSHCRSNHIYDIFNLINGEEGLVRDL